MALLVLLPLLLATRSTSQIGCVPESCTGKSLISVGSSSAGSDCTSIQAAIDCVPNRTAAGDRVTIVVSPGVYNESLRIHSSKGKLSIIGKLANTPDAVQVVTDQTCGGADPTVECGTLFVGADDFVLAHMTLINAPFLPAGKTFAIEVAGDRAAVYSTRILGKDDVVFTGKQRVYFRDTFINGSTDFNFGQGSAVYDNCTLMAQPGQYWSFITAHAGNSTIDLAYKDPPTDIEKFVPS